jgi:hypothetical protein
MRISTRISLALCVALLASLIATASVLAAPITVNLRVEGSSKTLFEGNITTDVRTIEAPDYVSKGETPGPVHPHLCDVNDNGEFPAGTFGASYGNPTTALFDAASSLGLPLDAYWYPPLHDFFINGIGSDETANWGYAVNYTTASVGGCQFQLAPSSEVLWAANFASTKHLLKLSGPSSVNIGTSSVFNVSDGQTGQPVSGAAIGEVVGGVTTTIPASPATDASGNATITIAHAGVLTLKATQAESVRSNGLTVCVHNGNDGACGTTVTGGGGPIKSSATTQTLPQTTVADVAMIAGVKDGHVYSRRAAPRVLAGVINVPVGGTLRQVRIRLERRYRGRCFDFSGSRVRFARARKCGTAAFFSVGGSESFSYLLPAPLPKGRYVYDIESVDSAGHTTKLVSGVSHVVFQVK